MDKAKICCSMREHFVIGIVGSKEGPAPVEIVDYIEDPTAKPMVILMKFCPFCGKPADRGTLRPDPRPRCERCGKISCEGFCSDD